MARYCAVAPNCRINHRTGDRVLRNGQSGIQEIDLQTGWLRNTMLESILLGAGVPAAVHSSTFILIKSMTGRDPLKLMKANVVGFILRLVLYGVCIGLLAVFTEFQLTAFILSFMFVFVFLQSLYYSFVNFISYFSQRY